MIAVAIEVSDGVCLEAVGAEVLGLVFGFDESVVDEFEYLPELLSEPELAAAPTLEIPEEPELPVEAEFAPVMMGEIYVPPAPTP